MLSQFPVITTGNTVEKIDHSRLLPNNLDAEQSLLGAILLNNNCYEKVSEFLQPVHFYAATHTDWLRNDMVKAVEAGLPVFVTEFGICDASGNGAIDEYQANEWIRIMNENAISYCGWNISNKNETSAIFKSGCNKTSGWTENDLSASGKWMYEMLRNTKLGD